MTSNKLGDLGQWLALITSVAGLITMIVTVSPADDTLVVAGSVLLTVATKIKYYGSPLYSWFRGIKLFDRRKYSRKHRRYDDTIFFAAEE